MNRAEWMRLHRHARLVRDAIVESPEERHRISPLLRALHRLLVESSPWRITRIAIAAAIWGAKRNDSFVFSLGFRADCYRHRCGFEVDGPSGMLP